MTVTERYKAVLEVFASEMPEPQTELHYADPFQLLVAVILSAQCTDKRINQITPALFSRFPSAHAMAMADADEIYEYISSVSYPNNKAKALAGMARRLEEDFGGEVPSTREELESLPGVGRKTASVMLSVVFGQPAMAVDTHVFRVAERIGLTTGSKNPLTTEQTLLRYIPAELVGKAHHWLILHGRYICKARNPLCGECLVSHSCRYFSKQK